MAMRTEDWLTEAIPKLIEVGIELPCTITIDDGAVHLVATAERRGRSYSDPDNPDNRVLLISVRVQSRGRIAFQCHRSDRRREPMRVICASQGRDQSTISRLNLHAAEGLTGV